MHHVAIVARLKASRWALAALSTLFVAGSAIVACGGENPPLLDSEGTRNTYMGAGACSTPNEGCACTDEGATTECGSVITQNADVVTCSMGSRVCTNGAWGACKGDHTIFHSASATGDLRALGLGGQTACTDNACDPNCQMVTDSPGGLDAGSGLNTTEAGLTLAGGDGGNCTGLQCQVASCDGGLSTTLTGTVFDPAGLNPLYHAYVYVPASTPLPALPQGAQADACGGGGNLPPSVTYQLTGPDGKFTLTGVPTGKAVPLVVQMGKWRRMVTVNVPACQTTALPSSQTRLPRNQSEGDIPHLAIVTGGCDAMECLLTRIGIDSKEFQDPGKGGRVDYYEAGGFPLQWGTNPPPANLLGSTATLSNYDLVMLPCDCGDEYGGPNAPWAQSKKSGGFGATLAWHQNLVTYTNGGGRLFTSHYGREWMEGGLSNYPQPFPNVANWTWGSGPDPAVGNVDQSFQRGKDFATWLKLTGASSTLGQITISPTRFDVTSVTAASQQWVQYASGTKGPADFTFNTPLGVAPAKQVGRVMYTDMHLASTNGYPAYFPAECPNGALTAQEKAAEFMLFDLGACLQPLPPAPPIWFSAASYSRQFTASCPAGKSVQWRTFYWEDQTPGDSNIVFTAQTGDTAQSLLSAVPLATVSGAANMSWVGANVDIALANANQKSRAVLQVNMTLNPTSDHQQAPTLMAWQQTFDCVDAL
jgi:hypothetical protein